MKSLQAYIGILVASAPLTVAFQTRALTTRRKVTCLGSLPWEEGSTGRRERYQRLEAIKERFASGKELEELRADVENLKENLGWAEAIRDEDRIRSLEKAILAGEERDPERAYALALERVDEAKRSPDINRNQLIEKWTIEAAAARASIPRFGLEGLWVGNYGEHGFEMINVTYSGDTLIARKVTGDKTVPRGEVTFTANLSARNQSNKDLKPIEMSSKSAVKWGMDKLTRYPGKGQVAKAGFVDAKEVEGQLIMFENHFSFVWVPTQHHVFFGRPTADVSIRMLRDIISEEDAVENMREHVKRCFEVDMTTSIARQHCGHVTEPFRRIKREADLRKIEEEEEESESKPSMMYGFLDFRRWKSSFGDAFGEKKFP